MNDNETQKKGIKKPLVIAILAVVLVFICGILIYYFTSDSSDKNNSSSSSSTQTANKETDDSDKTDATDKPDTTTDSSGGEQQPDTTSLPEPTLNPTVADDTILDTDPEPEIERKQHQKTFNDCMEAGDYEGAKAELDSYFATSEYALAGDETFSNYTYYYEKQGLYEDSVRYQLDFLEQHMGLDNIVEANTRYAHLKELLPHVNIEDERIQKIENSVARWKEIEQLLADKKIDTCISRLTGYMEEGINGVYAFYYLSKAYNSKPDYLSEAKTYYIYLLRMQQKEKNILESSYSVLFQQNLTALYESGKITEENRNFLEDEITADNNPY